MLMQFDTLYEALHRPVYAYFSACFGPQTAEDLTQTTFLRVWRHLRVHPLYTPDSDRAWVFRIAINCKNDHLRRKQREGVAAELPEQQPADTPSPAQLDEAAAVSAALGRLSDAERDLLLLKNLGLTSAEIGRLLRLSASAVRSRTAAAKKQFAQKLRECGVEIDG